MLQAQQVATVSEADAVLVATIGSALPVALWLLFFYTRDRYEREPKLLIAGLFFVGAVPVSIVAGIVNVTFKTILGGLLVAILTAPVAEEILKYLGMRLPVRRHRAFNEPIDGMIYGSTVGLGFAFTENIDYLVAGYIGVPMRDGLLLCEPGIQCFLELAFVRGTGTALMHALATGIAGYYLAKRALAGRPRGIEVKGVALAVLVHALWNMGLHFPVMAAAAAGYAVLSRRALAASPHRLRELDDAHHWIEHFAVGDGLLQPCPRCTRLRHPGQRYCSVCGLCLLPAGSPHSDACTECGEPQPVGARYCSSCGVPREGALAAGAMPAPEATRRSAP